MWTFMRDYRWSTILLAGFLLCTDKTTAFQPHHHRLSSTGLSSAPFERLQPITRPNYVPHQQNPSKPNRWRSPTLLSRFSTKSVVGDEEPRTPTKWIHSVPKPLLAAMILIGLDVLFSKLLQAFSIGFPSSLAGCGALFVLFLFAPGGASLYELLSPGAALFAKWLPVFFVPSLVTLPLADSLGSVEELLKAAVVVIGGFYFTLLTTAYTVVRIRKRIGPELKEETQGETLPNAITLGNDAATTPTTPPKPFPDKLNNQLRGLTAVSFVMAVLSSRIGTAFSAPLTSLFMLSTTLTTFVFGARLPKQFVNVVHPLLTCTSLTWAAAFAYGKIVGKNFLEMIRSYCTKRLGFSTTGAGDILLFMLGPAVIALACQMYDKRQLIRENIVEVGSAIAVSAFGGLFGTAAAVRILQIASPYLKLSLLSRNITSPLAMAIANILGADVSLAVSLVVITGLIGANFGASILDSFQIKDAVARGLSIGAAAHGLGTAAFVDEKDAFPFAAIAMALTASATTVIVSIPLFKRLLLQLAFGG